MSRSPRKDTPDGTTSVIKRVKSKEFSIITNIQAAQLLEVVTAPEVERLLVQFVNYSGATHDWIQQWELDYFTNGITELTGTSLALPAVGGREKYSAAQLVMAVTTMKFALSFYRGELDEASRKETNPVRRLLTELESYPSGRAPLMNSNQVTDLGDYLSKIFGNSFVRMLLRRSLCETPHRLEWKINRPLSLRQVSPEPPAPTSAQLKSAQFKSKKTKQPKKRGKRTSASPPGDPSREAATQTRPDGLLPLRLAAPMAVLYQLYTGQPYDEEELKKKKKKGGKGK